MYATPDSYRSPRLSDPRLWLVWAVVSGGSILLLASVIAAPLLLESRWQFAGQLLYQVFGPVCHQMPERSFFVGGHQFAVCARCTGLYVGFALAATCYPLIKSLRHAGTPQRKWLFLATLPLTIDFSLTFFGIWENTHSSRFVTGLVFGSAVVFYILPGLLELAGRPRLLSLKAHQKQATMLTTALPTDHLTSLPTDYSAPQRRI